MEHNMTENMSKEELRELMIKTQCRYFKGEKESPAFDDPNKRMLWYYESIWLDLILNDAREKELNDLIGEYIAVGLGDFRAHDRRPTSFKALLYNRYAKGLHDQATAYKDFKKFYNQYY